MKNRDLAVAITRIVGVASVLFACLLLVTAFGAEWLAIRANDEALYNAYFVSIRFWPIATLFIFGLIFSIFAQAIGRIVTIGLSE